MTLNTMLMGSNENVASSADTNKAGSVHTCEDESNHKAPTQPTHGHHHCHDPSSSALALVSD